MPPILLFPSIKNNVYTKCVIFLSDGARCLKKKKNSMRKGMGCFWLTICRSSPSQQGSYALAAGAVGGSCDLALTEEAQTGKCLCSACFLSFSFFPRFIMNLECLPLFRVTFPFSVKTLWKCPHRNTTGMCFLGVFIESG